MPDLSGAEAIVDGLIANGVDTIFALPGGQLDHLFDAVYHRSDELRVIHSRHEQGVAYMAYGYARSTGREGVYAVVPGPGLLNSSAALCTAWANYAPVLCISGQIPSESIGRGYGELHEIPDQLGMISHITKWSHRIGHPAMAPAAVEEAFRQLRSGSPRPVELEMAMDVMGSRSPVAEAQPGEALKPPPVDDKAVEQAAQILAKAEKPLIYVGSGAIGAREAVGLLAERLNAPVVSCRGGKGIVPDDHALAANFPLGHRLWGESDAVVAIGTRLHWPLVMWGKDPALKLIRVDIDPEQVSRICTPEVGIVADAAEAVASLLEALPTDAGAPASYREHVERQRESVDREIREKVAPQMAFLDVIREELPDDGIFVDEVTQVGFVSWYGFPVYAPRQFVSAGYQGTLGFGYPTALGVVAGNPDKRVVQVSGDGGFMFNVQELATAVQYGLPLVSIIFNDNRFTNVQRQQKEWFDGRILCSDLHNPDFMKLADAFGLNGMRVTDPEGLRRAMREAWEKDGPALIEVELNEFFPAPWPFLMMPQNREYVCR